MSTDSEEPTIGDLIARYPEVTPFSIAMYRELWANRTKGDQPGWRTMSLQDAWKEMAWHQGKLAGAIRARDEALIRELAADVANGAMMLADILNQTIARELKATENGG